ncbi:hypothetical protein QYF36_013253 [Acer negundo]|nr:hypothetical protein QYF36_013253 [Acer negundo]
MVSSISIFILKLKLSLACSLHPRVIFKYCLEKMSCPIEELLVCQPTSGDYWKRLPCSHGGLSMKHVYR